MVGQVQTKDIRVDLTDNGAVVKWVECSSDSRKPYDDKYEYREMAFISGVEGEYGIGKIGDFLTQKVKEAIASHLMKSMNSDSGEQQSPKIEIEIKP